MKPSSAGIMYYTRVLGFDPTSVDGAAIKDPELRHLSSRGPPSIKGRILEDPQHKGWTRKIGEPDFIALLNNPE